MTAHRGADPDGQPLFIPVSGPAGHSPDPQLAHPSTLSAGNGFMPHRHLILEDEPVEVKQRVAAHMDRYHGTRDLRFLP
jgi:hypothetical protein